VLAARVIPGNFILDETGRGRMAMSAEGVFFYASVGPRLALYHVDVAACALAPQGAVTLPANVQYAWPHPSAPVLYVASSNGGPGVAGDRHHLSAWRIDRATGALSPHGEARPLNARPIHLSLDRAGAFVLVAYNNPSGLSVHRLAPDGTLGAEVVQRAAPDAGVYAHQIRVTPSNAAAILVTRGNDAAQGKAEEPGALKLFGFTDGQLANRASIAPGGGYGFGPRHLDFHPSRPWLYVSLERQNKLQLFTLADDALEPAPRFSTDTLADPGNLRQRQIAGAVHVHPAGHCVYVANRGDAMTEFRGASVFGGGENAIAVFALAPETGEPRLVQHADAHGFHPRSFALDPSGRMLVAANLAPRAVRDGERVRVQPATLACYRVAADGTLAHAQSYDIATGGALQFWSGMVALP
jgi:6-phosphogluconolactonase